MTTPTLPVDGQTAWGDELNLGILQVNTNATNAQNAINNHGSNTPADPHGDRAFAQSLVSPITTGVNGPNGYVKTNSQGAIPAGLITAVGGAGGMYTDIFDAVATYGMATGGGDASVACQNACNAAGSAGGGIVWIGPGTFSFANYVVIPTNVWILMSEGTVINRRSGSPTPSYLFTNVKFGTSNTPSTNIRITGGKIDATANGLTSACTPIFIIQSFHTIIEDTRIFSPYGNPAIELNGINTAFVKGCKFGGTNHNTFTANVIPAIRINISNTGTTPSGLAGSVYNQSVCNSVAITGCLVDDELPGQSGPFGAFVASDLVSTNQISNGQFHTGIVITGNKMLYNGFPSLAGNGTWSGYSVTGNVLPEGGGSAGWIPMFPENGFNSSGIGANAQWRYVNTGITGEVGGAESNASIFTAADAIEIIGDITTGANVANGTVAFALTGVPPGLFNIGQTVPVTMFNVAPPTGVRFFFTGNTLQANGMSTLNNQRMFFHAILSMSA